MPLVNVKLVEGVFDAEQKQRIVRDLTVAMVSERSVVTRSAHNAAGPHRGRATDVSAWRPPIEKRLFTPHRRDGSSGSIRP